jgi:uncharacterized protein
MVLYIHREVKLTSISLMQNAWNAGILDLENIMVQYFFEWDARKDTINQQDHGVAFMDAREAFYDENRIIVRDERHSQVEERLFCIGKTPRGILTVCFTMRGQNIRIIGAGYWRKWRKFYEKARQI